MHRTDQFRRGRARLALLAASLTAPLLALNVGGASGSEAKGSPPAPDYLEARDVVTVKATNHGEGDDEMSPGAPRKVSPEEARRNDAAAYAELDGISEEEAMRRLDIQDETLAAVSEARRDHPAEFVGSWMDESQPYRGVVLFTDLPSAAQDELEASYPNVDFERGAALSEAELFRRSRIVHRDVTEAYSGTDVVTGFDVRTQLVEVTVEVPDAMRDKSDDELRRRLPDSARNSGVEVEYIRAEVLEPQHTYAGAKTTDDVDGSWCTTGFSVSKNFTDGIMTAGHCGNDRWYWEPGGFNDYDLPFAGDEHNGEWGDAQWHTSSHVELAEFRADWGDRRDVLGVRGVNNLTEGLLVGVFGVGQGGRATSKIYRTDVAASNNGHLVVMEGCVTEGGDSGGPWYRNNNAIGVHEGCPIYDGIRRSTFTSVSYTDEAIGVAIMVK